MFGSKKAYNTGMKLIALLLRWIPLACITTIVCALIYVTVQQNYRQNADDPQIQMAEDTATALGNGQVPPMLNQSPVINMATSLAPYIIIFDNQGHPVTASVALNGTIPVPPHGVFDYTKTHGDDRFTWQPQTDVRSAAVVVPYHGEASGFVLAGRSLREVEKREAQLTHMVGIAWIIALGASLLALASVSRVRARLS